MDVRFIAPIQNFSCAKNKVELGDNTFLLKYSDKEVREIESFLKKKAKQLYINEILDQVRSHFVVKTIRPVEAENISPSLEPIWLFFENILNALRVFKKGDAWFTNIYGLEHAGKGGTFPQAKYFAINGLKITPYQLDSSEIIAFRNFWAKFKEATKKIFIDRAVRRFGQAIERTKLDDKLLDYMISFECLLSTGGGESTHKTSRRTAVLLEHGKKACDIAQNMRTFYKYRSEIVHGSEINYKAIDKEIELIENYLRRCLKTIIQEKQFDKNCLIKYLDYYRTEKSGPKTG